MPEKPPNRLQHIIYWLVIAASLAVAAGAGQAVIAMGFPSWAAITAAIVVYGLAAWFVGGSKLNPDRITDMDVFGRSFPTVIRHWLRARGLRSRKVDWRQAYERDLPAYVSEALKKTCYDGPQVAADVDGLLWAIAEGDYWEGNDPPEYSILAFDSDGKIRASDNFYSWPKGWILPAGCRLLERIPQPVRSAK
jgi:hypothetical protein